MRLPAQYCNELLFRSVHWIRSRGMRNSAGSLLPAIFMHLPNSSVSTLAENVAYAQHVATRLLLSLVDSSPSPNQQGVVVLAAGWFAALVVTCIGVAAVAAYFLTRYHLGRREMTSLESVDGSLNLHADRGSALPLL